MTSSAPDPAWITQIFKGDTGEDFLGLLAVQSNITAYLLPGIITITPRARYYSFYAWLLCEHATQTQPGCSLNDFIRRREQIFALANLVHDATLGTQGLIGKEKLQAQLEEYRPAGYIPLSIPDYVQAESGGYTNYVGVMQTLGLTRYRDTDPIEILPRGAALGASFQQAIATTAYYQNRDSYDTAEAVPLAVLEEFGQKCHLSALDGAPDQIPILETLFAFQATPHLPAPDSPMSPLGNMRGTLGCMLDMLAQSTTSLADAQFRERITYGSCPDYECYQPQPEFKPILAHWRMFQLREYYTYALYSLWGHFLRWLKHSGPAKLQNYREYLEAEVDLAVIAKKIGIHLPARKLSAWSLSDWLDALLTSSGIPSGDWKMRCNLFAQKSQIPTAEKAVHAMLNKPSLELPESAGLAFILLSVLELRLEGLRADDSPHVWRWAEEGKTRRRSMALFAEELARQRQFSTSLLDIFTWLYRDYIITQHTISALEKWRGRKVNTFHFNYVDGVFEWVEDDGPSFTATRFAQANRMLADLGLYKSSGPANTPVLTPLGEKTLLKVQEALHAGN